MYSKILVVKYVSQGCIFVHKCQKTHFLSCVGYFSYLTRDPGMSAKNNVFLYWPRAFMCVVAVQLLHLLVWSSDNDIRKRKPLLSNFAFLFRMESAPPGFFICLLLARRCMYHSHFYMQENPEVCIFCFPVFTTEKVKEMLNCNGVSQPTLLSKCAKNSYFWK